MSKPTDLKRHRLIVKLRAAGMSYQAIADQFGVSAQRVHQILRSSSSPAGRLLIAGGEIDEVLPLDDAEALERAKPITPDGRVQIDEARTKAREDAQVRAVLDKGPFALIVLGGAHDLSDSGRQLGGGHCEYIRVTTRRFRELSE